MNQIIRFIERVTISLSYSLSIFNFQATLTVFAMVVVSTYSPNNRYPLVAGTAVDECNGPYSDWVTTTLEFTL